MAIAVYVFAIPIVLAIFLHIKFYAFYRSFYITFKNVLGGYGSLLKGHCKTACIKITLEDIKNDKEKEVPKYPVLYIPKGRFFCVALSGFYPQGMIQMGHRLFDFFVLCLLFGCL